MGELTKFCEVRIPTYKRPAWLKRALESLLSQDYPHWKAVVIDDSMDQEGRDVVAGLADERIVYSPNERNLGGCSNLDKAFQSSSMLGGTWACVLEDDNWLLNSYLSSNIKELQTHNVKILMRNQSVWFQSEKESTPTGGTTRGNSFSEKQYDPIELHSYLFFFEGASNGGLFWDTSMRSDLQVGEKVKDSGLQEYCRTLQINESLYFKSEPLCVWSDMPRELISRSFGGPRSYSRGLQSISRYLIRRYGDEIIRTASTLPLSDQKEQTLELALLNALYLPHEFRYLGKRERVRHYLKALARYVLIADPLKDYFDELDQRTAQVEEPVPASQSAVSPGMHKQAGRAL